MVVTAPATSPTAVMQERTAAPSMCTVQAPHCATPQPYFVPVRPITSRITHKRGISAGTSTSYAVLLTVSLIAMGRDLPEMVSHRIERDEVQAECGTHLYHRSRTARAEESVRCCNAAMPHGRSGWTEHNALTPTLS